MPKVSWNDFVAQYPNSPGFVAAVSRSLPKKAQFDKKGLKLPTPYALFQDWLQQNLTGDWATTSVPGGFVVRVATQGDAQLIQKKYPLTGAAIKTPAAQKTYPFSYRDASYGALAKALGYSV
jgi:hypothetical protein